MNMGKGPGEGPIQEAAEASITSMQQAPAEWVAAASSFSQPTPVGASDDPGAGDACQQRPLWLSYLADYTLSLTEAGREAVRQAVPEDLHDDFAMIMAVRAARPDSPANVRTRREEEEYERAAARDAANARLRQEKAGPPSWGRIDPAQALEAARTPREPEVGRFRGEPAYGVFYAGCVNGVHGESESGKSWLVLYVTAQELKAGHGVVYADYEDDEGAVYRRLKLLGVSEAVLAGDLFRYHRPNGPMTEAEKVTFMESVALGGSLAVFDGLTEGMSLEGLDGRLEKDVAAWHGKITKGLAHDGWCVVVIDHTPHEGNRAIGSQHKKSCITGVSYLADPAHPIGAGLRGVLRMKVEKDRPGSIRREAAPGPRPQWRGDLVVDFADAKVALDGQPDIALWPALPKDAEPEPVPDLSDAQLAYLRALVEYGELGASGTTIGKDMGKARSVVERAMVRLGAFGCVGRIGATSRFGITELGARALAEADQGTSE
ncbi:hypothetical protein [Streptomyces sp. AC495_CC817]|uniref:hypothetical protein n=1 Tax=Streptomyces sp. AC495_CC817 TaxID=2823900 RepID=UPI001C253F8F|nr:hypothetical protein [Streptomyces sp. AC495_CC817]